MRIAVRISTQLALACLIASSPAGEASAADRTLLPATRPAPGKIALVRSAYQGDVYLLRGFADIFSRGLDELGAKLSARGIRARVISHGSWESAAAAIIANQKRYGRKPVILIGHSLGANAAIRMAERLRQANISVQYLVTFAATDPDPVPDNVEKAANYYFATHGWGEKVVGARGFHGAMENNDYSLAVDIGHFNIEKQADIHTRIIRNVLRYIRPSGTTYARS